MESKSTIILKIFYIITFQYLLWTSNCTSPSENKTLLEFATWRGTERGYGRYTYLIGAEQAWRRRAQEVKSKAPDEPRVPCRHCCKEFQRVSAADRLAPAQYSLIWIYLTSEREAAWHLIRRRSNWFSSQSFQVSLAVLWWDCTGCAVECRTKWSQLDLVCIIQDVDGEANNGTDSRRECKANSYVVLWYPRWDKAASSFEAWIW